MKRHSRGQLEFSVFHCLFSILGASLWLADYWLCSLKTLFWGWILPDSVLPGKGWPQGPPERNGEWDRWRQLLEGALMSRSPLRTMGAPSHGWPLGSGMPLHMEVYGTPLTESQGRESCGIYPPTSMCHWFRAGPGKPLCTPVCPHSPHRPSTPRSQQKPPGILRCQQWDATSMAHWSGGWQVSTGRVVTMSASCYMYGIVIELVVSDSLRSHGL